MPAQKVDIGIGGAMVEAAERDAAVAKTVYELKAELPKKSERLPYTEVQLRVKDGSVGIVGSGTKRGVEFRSAGKHKVSVYCVDKDGYMIGSGESDVVVVEASDGEEQLRSTAERVMGTDNASRKVAAAEIVAGRSDQINVLMGFVEKYEVPKEAEREGPFQIAVKVLAQLRAVEASELMLDRVDVRRRFRPGSRPVTRAYFPCAAAAVDIGGGREVLESLRKRIGKEESIDRRRLYTWIAQRLLGSELASMWLIECANQVKGAEGAALAEAGKEATKGDVLLLMVLRSES